MIKNKFLAGLFFLVIVLFPPTFAWAQTAKVDTLLPDAAGAVLQWTTPPAGCNNHFECIDEGWPTDDGTTELQATADGQTDRVGVSWAPTDFVSCDSVVIIIRHNETGGGTKNVDWGVYSNTTSFYPDTLSTSAGAYTDYRGTKMTVDPATSSAWTEANINTLQIAYHSISGHTTGSGGRYSWITAAGAIIY